MNFVARMERSVIRDEALRLREPRITLRSIRATAMTELYRSVVPANAGTHAPRPMLFQKVSNASILADRTRRVGSGIRRDDVWMVLREDDK